MRLIDADALKKHITEIFEIEEKIDKKWAMGLKYSLKIIDNAPTIESERSHIIDNCDMNVFEPEKYMEGGAE